MPPNGGGNIDSSDEFNTANRVRSAGSPQINRNTIELQRIQLVEAETQLKYAFLNKQNEQQERENARQRETTLAQAGKRDITPALLAYLLMLGY
ncbi:hypothetical protein [Candidatus Regiella insecticola]|uniref:hypothetical protein n=1 Tax=Candidatus Regiella insecticola TaxID=138073 RepID=UPI0005874371|nr:hypothetical protein [Candidatus Regiella insecticola]